MELLEQYLRIEEVRFGDRLDVELDVDPEVEDVALPTMILQPLVENAIRYGVERSSVAGRISILAAGVNGGGAARIIIENDGPPVSPEQFESPDGLGLSNTRERLREAFPSSHTFDIQPRESGGVRVEIVLERDQPQESEEHA